MQASHPHTCSPVSLVDPQFIKATIVHQDQAYDDKIYYFFREDNPDKNPEAPLNVSRVAQLCRVSGSGRGPSGRVSVYTQIGVSEGVCTCVSVWGVVGTNVGASCLSG